jgi:hypothetical protein
MYNNDWTVSRTKVSQHGSNMVMTNVSKPTKEIPKHRHHLLGRPDPQLRKLQQNRHFSFTIPEKITDVKPSKSQTQIPYSFYSIAASLGNSYLKIVDSTNNEEHLIIVDDGTYGGHII